MTIGDTILWRYRPVYHNANHEDADLDMESAMHFMTYTNSCDTFPDA